MKRYDNVPEELQPIGAWSYFWLSVLYKIPLIGFIVLIIQCLAGGNVNKRSFARSQFCGIALLLIIVGFFFLIVAVTGSMATFWANLSTLFQPKE